MKPIRKDTGKAPLRLLKQKTVLSCPVLSCPVLSSLVLACLVLSCPVLSCHVLSCPVLSCAVLSCPVLSCAVLSCPVLSCPVLSCPVLSHNVCRVSFPCGKQPGSIVGRVIPQHFLSAYLAFYWTECKFTSFILSCEEASLVGFAAVSTSKY